MLHSTCCCAWSIRRCLQTTKVPQAYAQGTFARRYYGLKGDLVSSFDKHGVVKRVDLRSHRVDLEHAVELVEGECLVSAVERLDEDQDRLVRIEHEFAALSTETFDMITVDAVVAGDHGLALVGVRRFTALHEDDVVVLADFLHVEVVLHRMAGNVVDGVILSGKFDIELECFSHSSILFK